MKRVNIRKNYIITFALVVSLIVFSELQGMKAYAFGGGFASEDMIRTGGVTTSIISTAALQLGIPIDMPIILSLSSILAEFKCHGIGPQVLQTISFGLLENQGFRIAVYVWGFISILPMMLGATNEWGVMIENLNSKYVGPGMGLLLLVSNALAYGDYVASNPILLADAKSEHLPVGALLTGTGLKVSILILYMLVWFMCYILIRTMFFFLDILLIPVCKLIPTSSFWIEQLRVIGSIIMIALAVFQPYVFLFFYVIMLIVAAFVFKKAVRTIRYFKDVYVSSAWGRLKGYSSQIPLVEKKVPHAVKSQLVGEPKLMIKVYFAKNGIGTNKMKRHDAAYLVADGAGTRLIPTGMFAKKSEPLKITPRSDSHRFVIHDQLLLTNVYSVGLMTDITRKIPKNQIGMHFVFSRVYSLRIPEIAWILGYEIKKM